MQLLIERTARDLPIPTGISVIGRWLSEATPPEQSTRNKPIPEGLQNDEGVAPNDFSNRSIKKNSGIPPGCNRYFATMSGGVAALNHRLIIFVPPGQIAVVGSCRRNHQRITVVSLEQSFRSFSKLMGNNEINDSLHERFYANIRITSSSTSTVNGAFPVISPSRFSLSFPCEWSANERT